MVRNTPDAPAVKARLAGLDPRALKKASDTYFNAPWLLPVATALGQSDQAIVGAAAAMGVLGIDRSTVLRTMDKLLEWGALAEIERGQEAAKNDKRVFSVVEAHFIWTVIVEIAEWEEIPSEDLQPKARA